MTRSLKIGFYSISAGVVLLVLIGLFLLYLVDVNRYKPSLEEAASAALGMDVRIGGQLQIGLFPGLLVTAEDINIRNQGKDVVSAKLARFGIDPIALFQKEVRLERIVLKTPLVKIELDAKGTSNFARPGAVENNLPGLVLAEVSISDGTLLFEDMQAGQKLEATDCFVEMNSFEYAGGKSSDLLKNLSFTAELACGKILKKKLTVSDLKFSVKGANGLFNLDPITMELFAAQGTGNVRADFSGVVPHYDIRYSLTKFQIEDLFKTLSPKKVANGTMDFFMSLSMQGKTLEKMRQSLAGNLLLEGKNLVLNGGDLDQKIAQFESSQNFNLVDIGATLLVGPLGLAISKGYDFVSILEESKGSSEIRTFKSDWKVERGVAQAQDVAMATNENRIVVKGQLDFVNEKLTDVIMAVIDDNGCVMVQQEIQGTFQNPIIDQPNILKSISGPVFSLLTMGRDLFPGGECEVFYAGSVLPPK